MKWNPQKKWQAYLPKHLDTDVDQDMFTTKPRLGGRVWSKATTVGKLATKPNTATFHYWRRQPARHMYSRVSTNLQLTETITATHSSCSTCWKHLVVNLRLNWSGWASSVWPLNNYIQIVETYSILGWRLYKMETCNPLKTSSTLLGQPCSCRSASGVPLCQYSVVVECRHPAPIPPWGSKHTTGHCWVELH